MESKTIDTNKQIDQLTFDNSEFALTTVDNPFDPFEDFTSWFLFDVEHCYNTCGYIARIAKLSDDMSQVEINNEIERAIDEIINYDFMNIYKKVEKREKIS